MSHLPEPRLAAPTPSAPSPGERGRHLSVCRASPSAFDTLETAFFCEGDALSTAAAPGDAWDEKTADVPRASRRRTRLLAWSAAGLAGFALCALGAWRIDRARQPRPVADLPPPVAPVIAAPAPAPRAAATVVVPRIPEAEPPKFAAATDEASDACQAAFARNQRKQVLASCARAFAANPQSPAIAVMLAKTELDRGHFRPALDWAKKALALDENQADAYVFVGGAEQALGNAPAAKTAYKRYLALAPKGRYASDVRAVVTSL
jgi:tetratricopeptide (TPR) repeat protein